jgi:peptidoglycan/LPS O-acetylase OafA/YrhL
VLAVVVEHLSYLVFLELRPTLITPYFDSGKYGVMVFFLVSGYIVPASLERHRSIRRFWVSRAFRLYPLLVLAVGTLLALSLVGLVSLDRRVSHDPTTVLLAHASFLQDVLGVANFLNVLWTLSYEMVFYLLITALFICGVYGRSAEIALGFGAASLLIAPVLPAVVLSRDVASTRWVVAVASTLLVAGLVLAAARGGGRRLAGGIVLGGLALVLLVFNQRAGMWEGLIILATMFTGTTIYQAERGRIGRGKAIGTLVTVWVLALVSGVLNFRLWPGVTGAVEFNYQRSWAVMILLVGATFAIAWLLRSRRFPRPLVWIGLISYSIYLMHTVLLSTSHVLFDAYRYSMSLAEQCALAGAFCATLFAVTALTYRYVERPAQRFGRRLGATLEPATGVTSATAAGGQPIAAPAAAAVKGGD